MKTVHFAFTGSIFQKILLTVFLFSQLSFSQKSPKFPPVLIDRFQKLQNLSRNDGFAINAAQNIFNSENLIEYFVPSFLRNSFESPEDFELFARSKLFVGVSDQCKDHTLEIFSQLFWSPLQKKAPATWALQMVDAWGKFPEGILSGHTTVPGDFHECLQIRGSHTNKISKETANFKGRYCSTYIVPTKKLQDLLEGLETSDTLNDHKGDILNKRDSVSPGVLIANSLGANGAGIPLFPFIGTCLPSSCSTADAANMLYTLSTEVTQGYLEQAVVGCYTDEKPPFDAGDIAVISLLSVIGCLCLIGSVYDLLVYRRRADSKSGSMAGKILVAFSVPLNTEKLLNTNTGGDNLGCLHGLRFLSMAWVVLGHTWEMSYFTLNWNLIDLQNMYRHWPLLTVLNGTVSVDTFFTISGTLMAFNLLKELNRNKGRFNYPLMVIHRYLRLTPTYLILLGILATIVPYLSTGPNWHIMDEASETCKKYWWYNALYINNLVDLSKMCLGQGWYLPNDMQFFLVAPLIIYPLWRWRKIGFAVLSAFCIASIATPIVIQQKKDLLPANIPFVFLSTFFEDLYITPWARMGSYLVGIFLGYILYAKSKSLTFRKLPVWAVLIGWTISTATALLIIYGIFDFFDPKNEQETLTSVRSAIYLGLNRFSWGLVIAWIIFACVSGYGGWINKFLSWKVFIPLGRLTYCVYICSYQVQQIYHLSQPHPVHYSSYATVNIYFAHMVMICLVGYVLTVTLESPFIQLEKLLLPPKRGPVKVKKELPRNVNDDNNNNQ